MKQTLVDGAQESIYVLKKIRNYTKAKIQNCETLQKLDIGIYSKFEHI